MRKLLTLACVASALALPACDRQAAGPGEGSLTGTWRYRAVGFKPMAVGGDHTCDIETTYTIRVENGQIEGRAPESEMSCTDGTRRWSDTYPAGVVRGEVRDGRVYVTNAGGWHSFGEVAGDRVEGYLESYGNYTGQPMETVRSGSFTMERISHAGYGGPAA